MILLDTNVVSEMMKQNPDALVHQWLNDQVVETLFVSSVTVAEILFGIAAMPAGQKRQGLKQSFQGFMKFITTPTLPFDATAAHQYSELASNARKSGKVIPMADAYIAAIAAAHRLTVATRNSTAFNAAGVAILNPWQHPTA